MGKSPRIAATAAARLAWYATDEDSGVLAPRGWHCITLYGSNGSFIVVTPERHAANEFFQNRARIRGPAVQLSYSFAGTSGRWEVMPVIARYFPKYRPFIQEMKKLELVFDPLPTRPFKTDIIRKRSAKYVRYTTPAQSPGEGTRSWLLPGSRPIEGFRAIVGTPDEPDVLGVDVRLARKDAWLTQTILNQAMPN